MPNTTTPSFALILTGGEAVIVTYGRPHLKEVMNTVARHPNGIWRLRASNNAEAYIPQKSVVMVLPEPLVDPGQVLLDGVEITFVQYLVGAADQ